MHGDLARSAESHLDQAEREADGSLACLGKVAIQLAIQIFLPPLVESRRRYLRVSLWVSSKARRTQCNVVGSRLRSVHSSSRHTSSTPSIAERAPSVRWPCDPKSIETKQFGTTHGRASSRNASSSGKRDARLARLGRPNHSGWSSRVVLRLSSEHGFFWLLYLKVCTIHRLAPRCDRRRSSDGARCTPAFTPTPPVLHLPRGDTPGGLCWRATMGSGVSRIAQQRSGPRGHVVLSGAPAVLCVAARAPERLRGLPRTHPDAVVALSACVRRHRDTSASRSHGSTGSTSVRGSALQ